MAWTGGGVVNTAVALSYAYLFFFSKSVMSISCYPPASFYSAPMVDLCAIDLHDAGGGVSRHSCVRKHAICAVLTRASRELLEAA